MRIYRDTRAEAKRLLQEVKAAGYETIVIEGDGDVAEICELTCLEQGVRITTDKHGDTPVLRVSGYQVELLWIAESRNSKVEVES